MKNRRNKWFPDPQDRYDIILPADLPENVVARLHADTKERKDGFWMDPFLVYPWSPVAARRSVETLAWYFRREFHYDFCQYSAEEPDLETRALLWTNFGRSAGHRPIGAAGFKWQTFETGRRSWELLWLWFHPFERRRGHLQFSWDQIREKFGDFAVGHPISEAMRAFLAKNGERFGRIEDTAGNQPTAVDPERTIMGATTQLNLFSPIEEPIAPPPEAPIAPVPEVAFGVALLALGSVRGLGHKGLRVLAKKYLDDIGRVLFLPRAQIAADLAEGRVASGEKFADTIANDREKLIREGQEQLNRLEDSGIQIVPPCRLPCGLRSINPDPPYWLFVQGNAALLDHRPMVALVGTRQPSEKGIRATGAVAKVLAPYPVAVVSGLAEGIDEEAHRTSLNLGLKNIAFLGHGIDSIFPLRTADLREQIVRDKGLVATEYLPGEHYQKRFFVQRNRLQAGLSDLVIPVEAKVDGGTAHTIRFAQRMSRPVVGIRWPGAGTFVDELEREGHTVVDVLTQDGFRKLDGIIRGVVERAGKEPFPLSSALRQLLREAKWRDVRRQDVKRLLRDIEDALKEPVDGQPEPSGNI